jgi:hypothetical protein
MKTIILRKIAFLLSSLFVAGILIFLAGILMYKMQSSGINLESLDALWVSVFGVGFFCAVLISSTNYFHALFNGEKESYENFEHDFAYTFFLTASITLVIYFLQTLNL